MSAIQSRMHLQRPDALELEYTRMVMGWLMLRPAAQSLAMIGLGGGSIAKFCHRHLPRTTMLVVQTRLVRSTRRRRCRSAGAVQDALG